MCFCPRFAIRSWLVLVWVLSAVLTAGAAKDVGISVFDPKRVAAIRFTLTASDLNKMLASKNAGLQADHKF